MRVGRRAAGPTGRESFVPIHTPPTVARDPLPGVYRDVRDSRNILSYCAMGSVGKGLIALRREATIQPYGRNTEDSRS